MSTKNESKRMSRWGDSDSDDEDESLPRASSFVNVPQIGLHDKEPQDNHHNPPSSMPSRNGSMNQKRHPKLNRNTKQATKGGKGRAGGAAKSNGRNADWREMARNSQKYGTTNGTYST